MTSLPWWAIRRTLAPGARQSLRVAAAAADHRLSVASAAEESPDAPALLVAARDAGSAGDDRLWTYRQLEAAVGDVPRPDRAFALVGERTLDVSLRLYAAWQAGVPVVPMHPRWTPSERSAFVAALEVPTEEGENPVESSGSVDPESILAVVATSGSSGAPRGVALSRRAVLAAADASAANLGWRRSAGGPDQDHQDDRWLVTLPLAHVGGLSILLRCLVGRACAVLPPPGTRFEAGTARAWIERFEITLLSVVPSMLRRLLDDPAPAPPSLRAVLVGGAPAPAALLQAARTRGWPVLATYGLSEACAQVATERPDAPRADGSVGPALPGVAARIESDGVLAVGGPTLMSGYVPSARPGSGLGSREATPWLRTGDLARIDPVDGSLRILGRADSMLVSGGENVQPQEVEAALADHPGVDEVCVVGVDDPTWGQRVVAVVAPRAGQLPALDDLRRLLAGRLAAFKHPRALVVVDALPRLLSGKVDRRTVARLAAADLGVG
ncbi:MAG: class I adenylate-forming enzyme family protein [Acidobacteriota bacterium]